MDWLEDAPETWEDAPEHPPVANSKAYDLTIVDVNGGYVARPDEEPEDGDVGTNSIFIDVCCDVGSEVDKWDETPAE